MSVHGRDAERGAVAVEFAILLPLLVIILFATIAFGLALSRLEVFVSGAREGARYAAVHCAPDASTCTLGLIQARVAQAVAPDTVGGTVSVSINGVAGQVDCKQAANVGKPVAVSWTQPLPIVIPFLPDMSVSVPVSGSFRCE
jgi:Flp pilus assembly protein TadG